MKNDMKNGDFGGYFLACNGDPLNTAHYVSFFIFVVTIFHIIIHFSLCIFFEIKIIYLLRVSADTFEKEILKS